MVVLCLLWRVGEREWEEGGEMGWARGQGALCVRQRRRRLEAAAAAAARRGVLQAVPLSLSPRSPWWPNRFGAHQRTMMSKRSVGLPSGDTARSPRPVAAAATAAPPSTLLRRRRCCVGNGGDGAALVLPPPITISWQRMAAGSWLRPCCLPPRCCWWWGARSIRSG